MTNIIDVLFTHNGFQKLQSDVEAAKIPNLKSLANHYNWVKSIDSSMFVNRLDVIARRKLDYLYRLQSQLDLSVLQTLVDELNTLDFVDFAEIRPVAVPSVMEEEPKAKTNRANGTDANIVNFISLQNYLNSPTENRRVGLNVHSAWNNDSGENCVVRHLDFGIYQDHDNFVDTKLTVKSNSDEGGEKDHGTASSSIIAGYNKIRGMRGIAYNCDYISYNVGTEELMTLESKPGDLWSLEFQYVVSYNGVAILLPPVYTQRIRLMIETAIADDVIAIYSGGNGNINIMDHPLFEKIPDCGGIMCCASVFNTGARASFSNYNFHKMLNAAGDWSVFAAGYGSFLTVEVPNKTWTDSYSGTSAAQPQLCGVIAVLNSYHKKIHGSFMTTESVYNTLTSTGNVIDSMIGAIPDLFSAQTSIEKADDFVYVINTQHELTLFQNPQNTQLEELSERYRKFVFDIHDNGTYIFYLNYSPEGTSIQFNNHASNAAVYVYGSVSDGILGMLTSAKRQLSLVRYNSKYQIV